MRPEIVPVILAGGRGTRLWPLTVARRPKPLLRLFGRLSLLQQSLLRVRHLAAPVILCHRSHAASVRRHVQEIDITATVLAEAAHGGTALALACAALHLRQAQPDSWMLVLPSDHAVDDESAFRAALQDLVRAAEDGGMAMLGAPPAFPFVRYGYILSDGDGRLAGFVEKPERPLARQLCAHGALWNTGIFLCRPEILLQLLVEHAPIYYAAACQIFSGAQEAGQDVLLPPSAVSLPPLSIDRAVMEFCRQGGVATLDAGWSDIGTWPALIRAWLRLAARLRIHIDPPQALRVSKLK